MEHFILETLPDLLREGSILAYILVFLGGIVSSLGPCNISMIPVIMAYVGGTETPSKTRGLTLSAVFTLGTSFTLALLGVLASVVGGFAGSKHNILLYVAAAICMLVGLNLLGVITLNMRLPWGARLSKAPKPGHVGAFFLGLVVGLAGSQCGLPVLLAILTIVMAKGKIAYGATLLFVYGLGRGVPVVAAGTFTGLLKNLPSLVKWTSWMERAAGVFMIGIGLYFLWTA